MRTPAACEARGDLKEGKDRLFRKSFQFGRKASLLVVGSVLAVGLVMAQAPKSEAKKPVKATIVLSSDTKFGDKMLRAGEYQVKCDGESIVFSETTNRDRASETYKFPCKGKELSAPSDRTELSATKDASGVPVAQKVLLKGSNVEHTFD